MLQISKQGNVKIDVALGVVNTIRLLNIQSAANLEHNIVAELYSP